MATVTERLHLDTQTSGFGQMSTLQIADASKIAHILTSSFYKDPLVAVIREVLTNAYDSHRELIQAGGQPEQPIKVYIDHASGQLVIADCGVGISNKAVPDLLLSLGATNKEGNEQLVGGWGLGAKSPFALASSWHFETRWYGKTYTWLCIVDDNNELSHSAEPLVLDSPSAPNGVTYYIPLKPADFTRATLLAQHFASHLNFFHSTDVPVEVQNEEVSPPPTRDNSEFVVTVDGMPIAISSLDRDKAHIPTSVQIDRYNKDRLIGDQKAILNMGGVPYTLNQLEGFSEVTIWQQPLMIKAPIGFLSLTPSRDELRLTERTKRNLTALGTTIADKFSEVYLDRILKAKSAYELHTIAQELSSDSSHFAMTCVRDAIEAKLTRAQMPAITHEHGAIQSYQYVLTAGMQSIHETRPHLVYYDKGVMRDGSKTNELERKSINSEESQHVARARKADNNPWSKIYEPAKRTTRYGRGSVVFQIHKFGHVVHFSSNEVHTSLTLPDETKSLNMSKPSNRWGTDPPTYTQDGGYIYGKRALYHLGQRQDTRGWGSKIVEFIILDDIGAGALDRIKWLDKTLNHRGASFWYITSEDPREPLPDDKTVKSYWTNLWGIPEQYLLLLSETTSSVPSKSSRVSNISVGQRNSIAVSDAEIKGIAMATDHWRKAASYKPISGSCLDRPHYYITVSRKDVCDTIGTMAPGYHFEKIIDDLLPTLRQLEPREGFIPHAIDVNDKPEDHETGLMLVFNSARKRDLDRAHAAGWKPLGELFDKIVADSLHKLYRHIGDIRMLAALNATRDLDGDAVGRTHFNLPIETQRLAKFASGGDWIEEIREDKVLDPEVLDAIHTLKHTRDSWKRAAELLKVWMSLRTLGGHNFNWLDITAHDQFDTLFEPIKRTYYSSVSGEHFDKLMRLPHMTRVSRRIREVTDLVPQHFFTILNRLDPMYHDDARLWEIVEQHGFLNLRDTPDLSAQGETES